MQSLSGLTIILCCAWAASILYGEMFAYWFPLWSCSWPSPQSASLMWGAMKQENQVNIAVLADPQIMDRTSLPRAPESFLFETAKFYTDLYMRRSFLSSILPFKPDMVIFLGDQFDGGPFLSEEEWYESFSRFWHIFDLETKQTQSAVKVKFLAGNHDIGYAGFHSLYQKVINRYEKEFGMRNYQFNVRGVEFIVVDAQTLDGSILGNLTSMSWEFIKNVSQEATTTKRVLLTHIPLYRPDGTPCGPHRSSPVVNQRVSYAGVDQVISYQNYLSEETSRRLLESFKPILVLSGHDHDQCTVTHSTSYGPVVEHTLGTISWQQGNLYPSFMLLTVAASASSNSTKKDYKVSTRLCFLPMQTHIYVWYLILFMVTLLLVSFWPTSGLGCWHHCEHFFGYIKNAIARRKEKDEDEICEYEEIWDAEGSMHLVKKATKIIPLASSRDAALTGRGTITARPQAKRYDVQEADISITLEMNAENITRGSRFGKSIVRKIVQRLIRVIRLLTIIAIVSIPLYVMILFKDWIGR